MGSGVRFGLSVVPKVTASHHSGKIKIADVCNAALERKLGYVILRAQDMLPQMLWNAIRSCDLVVADSPWDLDVGGVDREPSGHCADHRGNRSAGSPCQSMGLWSSAQV